MRNYLSFFTIAVKRFFVFLVFLTVLRLAFSFETPQINISFVENVQQFVRYNPLEDNYSGYNSNWIDEHENQSYYNITGKLIIKNVNQYSTNTTLGDMWIVVNHTNYVMWFSRDLNTMNATIYGYNNSEINYSMSSDGFFNNTLYAQTQIIIHIPKIAPGENVTFDYYIDPTRIRPPLNLITFYSRRKIVAGNSFQVFDVIKNVFDNRSYQIGCIYDINITFKTIIYHYNESTFDFMFVTPKGIDGDDASNAHFVDNYTLNWHALSGACLNYQHETNISYWISTPEAVPKTDNYDFINTTLRYKIDSTISYMNIMSVKARADKIDFNLTKKIVDVARDNSTEDHNVTWEIRSFLSTRLHNITFNVTKITLWVSVRQQNNLTDLNYIDNDTISSAPLIVTYDWNGMTYWVNSTSTTTRTECKINQLLNEFMPYSNYPSCTWRFNYSELPTPIVWMKFDHTIITNNYSLYNNSGDSDLAQIQSHALTTQLVDTYIKQIYVIVNYWLLLRKNITALSNDTYLIRIEVHNHGNRWTPINSPVSIYDFVPKEFTVVTNLSDTMNYSIYPNSSIYYTIFSSKNISGYKYDGTLLKWTIMWKPTNPYNASLAPGYKRPWNDTNSTWYVEYVVKGRGEYKIHELYIVGLDPELVDGAATNFMLKLREIVLPNQSPEPILILSSMASVLLLLMIKFKND